jgi:hypothetical protein
MDGNRATGESYTIAHHIFTEDGSPGLHTIYAAQSRRQSLSVDKSFEYGPHRDPVVHAGDVVHVGHMIETALIAVLDALSDIVGREGLAEVMAQQASNLERVRIDFPLDDLEPTRDRSRELALLTENAEGTSPS